MKKGFTLIEILVIITLIAILTSLFVYLVNPIEVAKRNRDLQRIRDLQALEIAINNYLNLAKNPDLDGPLYDLTGLDEDNSSIYISIPVDQSTFNFSTITDAYGNLWQIKQNSSATNVFNPNGEGWLPINFNENNQILPQLPVDPLNIINNSQPIKNYFYLYVFRRDARQFEVNANLESRVFKETKNQFSALTDGGSDEEILEVGNNKCLIAFGTSGSIIYGTTTLSSCQALKLNFGINYGNLMGQDICWNKLFNFYPTRNYVFRNKAGDYLVIGNNYLSSNTSSFLAIFLDKFGNPKFIKTIYLNTSSPLDLNYIHQLPDESYVLGYNLSDKSILIKTDKDFNPQWSRLYCSGSDCSAVQKLVFINNNFSGNINLIRNIGYYSGFQLVEISSSTGDILSGGDYYYQITFGRIYAGNKTQDDGFILLGSYGYMAVPPAFLAKFDNQNKIEWIKQYDNIAFSSYFSMDSPRNNYLFQTNDGGYFFNAMYDKSLNATSYIFVKTDYQGNLAWIKKYTGDYSTIDIRRIFQDKKNNFWLVVNSSSENYLIKLNQNFDKLTEYKITALSSNDRLVFNNFLQLDDNSYLLIGSFIDDSPFIAYLKKITKIIEAFGDDLKPEEFWFGFITKYYFNLIRFVSDKNLFYLKNNLYNITTTNIFSFSTISSPVSDISSFSTSNYNLTSTPLSLTSRVIKPNQKILVNQCDNYFSKNIGKNKKINKLIRADDGYVAVGEDLLINTSSFWIAKFDINGNIIVSSSSLMDPSYISHQFRSVIYDGNYFVTLGNYYQNDPVANSGYLAQFDSSLKLIMDNSFDSSYFSDITYDGINYIVVGRTNNNYGKIWLITSTTLKDISSINFALSSQFNSVLNQTNVFIFAGGEINNQSYLVKVKADLSYRWQKEYILKIGSRETIKKIIFADDGNIIALTNMFDPDDNRYKLILRKINPDDGEVIQEKLISNDYFYGNDIILDYDNNFLITGYLPLTQDGNNFSDWSLALMKVDKNFNLVWVKYYGGQSRDEISFGSSIVEADNAGYLIGGYNGALKGGWLLKVSYEGDCLGCSQLGFSNKIIDSFKNNLANFLNLILR
ncbi:MAG: hypothetical protein KatS3mg094_213 [Candidatus Parcubacteria bacterium]|nr:MAG: hypothetical protein KatS3mg094_213 [Candidatus Parcubacteria bacterium]